MADVKHTPETFAKIGELAVFEEAARRERAAARTDLRNLRRKWISEYDSFFDAEEHASEPDTPAMLGAIKRRDVATRDLRTAQRRTRAAISKATGAARATGGGV